MGLNLMETSVKIVLMIFICLLFSPLCGLAFFGSLCIWMYILIKLKDLSRGELICVIIFNAFLTYVGLGTLFIMAP
jgi:hypothetical protein